MQSPSLILLGMALTAAVQAAVQAAGEAPAAPERPSVDAALARYDKLPAAGRERWIREMLVRLDRANAVMLRGDEVVRQRARTDKFARLVAGGYRPPRTSLENLLAEVQRRERQAVESLARRYRIQIYRTFRQQEDVFRGRKAAWDRAEAAWRAAGSPIHSQHQLIDWLVVATYRSTPGTIGSLPGVPDFGPQIGLPGAWPGGLAGRGEPPDLRLPGPVLRPELPARQWSPGLPSTGPPRELESGVGPEGDWLLPAPARPDPAPADLAAVDAARVAARPRIRPSLPGERVPPIAGQARPIAGGEPPVAALPAGPVPDLAGRVPTDTAWRRGTMPGPPVEQPAVSENGSVSGDWLVPHSRGEPERSEPASADLASAGQVRSPTRSVPGAASVTQREPVPEPLLASAFPRGEWPAFPAEPAAPQPAARQPNPEAMPADPGRSRLPGGTNNTGDSVDAGNPDDENPASPRVRVNLNELSAGIAGANLALRALEAELDNDLPPSARDLAGLVDRLEVLVLRHDDLALFCDLVTPEQRRRAGRLESPRALIPRLANKVFELRSRASGDDFPGDEAERELELKILGQLSRQLAELAEQKDD